MRRLSKWKKLLSWTRLPFQQITNFRNKSGRLKIKVICDDTKDNSSDWRERHGMSKNRDTHATVVVGIIYQSWCYTASATDSAGAIVKLKSMCSTSDEKRIKLRFFPSILLKLSIQQKCCIGSTVLLKVMWTNFKSRPKAGKNFDSKLLSCPSKRNISRAWS